ncbi:MAG: c-type cytochrome domain-containing protein, partial [Verrucomicrobiota bacterium]
MKKVLLSVLLIAPFSVSQAVDFETEVYPIFKGKCAKCHMNGETKGDLSLDKKDIADYIGPDEMIIPGNAKHSAVFDTMLLPTDDDFCMPPKGPRVPKDQITLIGKWIDEGAKLESTASSTPAPTAAPAAPAEMTDSMSDDPFGGGTMEGGDMAAAAPAAPAADAPPAGPKPYKGSFVSVTGKKLDAELLRVEGDRIILKLPDQREYKCPIGYLNAATQDTVKKFQAG